MREIKFRVKPSPQNTLFNAPWIYFFPLNHVPKDTLPETVGQYTGLVDKHGTEIYEGDLVTKDDNVYGEVVFKNGRFLVKLSVPYTYNSLAGYGFADGGTRYSIQYAGLDRDCRVAGNIYEHPHLIKKENL